MWHATKICYIPQLLSAFLGALRHHLRHELAAYDETHPRGSV